MTKAQQRLKRCFDLLGALIGLAVLLVPILIVTLLVKVFSRGPVLFTQERIGHDAKSFRIVKFRTMRVNSANRSHVTAKNDERLTGIGRLLRRFKLDEMPQLWNILVGDMSFVGPRPDVPGYADKLKGADRRLLSLRPGVTGPATLFFRNEEKLLAGVSNPVEYNDEVIYPTKVRLNIEYMENWLFWRDVAFLVVTVCPWLDRWLKVVPVCPRDG